MEYEKLYLEDIEPENWFDIPDPRHDPTCPGRVFPIFYDEEPEYEHI
jgi:hypothetical protein